jgi:hypothetical protein
MKGQYTGFYKYDSETLQKVLARDQTFFDIEIQEFDGEMFSGKVREEAGGQPGPGTITGHLHGNNISFIKQMDIAATIWPDGSVKTHNARHPKIYYSGTHADGKFTGTWKIKFGFIFAGFFPIPIVPTSGTWEMRKK